VYNAGHLQPSSKKYTLTNSTQREMDPLLYFFYDIRCYTFFMTFAAILFVFCISPQINKKSTITLKLMRLNKSDNRKNLSHFPTIIFMTADTDAHTKDILAIYKPTEMHSVLNSCCFMSYHVKIRSVMCHVVSCYVLCHVMYFYLYYFFCIVSYHV
jgi:hypothetical protein